MIPDLVIRARRAVVDRDGVPHVRPAVVHVEGRRVVAVEGYESWRDTDPAVRFVDLPDDVVLLPGLVDTHVHVNEPGRTEWEGFASATRAAAAGGVTTILDMPLNSIPPTVTVDRMDRKIRAALGKTRVNVGFWGGAVPHYLRHIPALIHGGAFGVKCFLLDSGVEEFPPLDQEQLRHAMWLVRQADGVLLVHAEDPAVVAQAPPPEGSSYAAFLASRPQEAEVRAVAEVLAAVRETGARVHIVHLAAADALPLLEQARWDGLEVTAETCPHYLVLDSEQVPDGATPYKCCPPIRDPANREALWDGLERGVIDFVVSDHSPCTPDLKRLDQGDFGAAWGGIASLQLGLPLVWTEARRRGHDLADVVRWMGTAPARFARLARKGRIAVGHDADLVAFAPDEELLVDPRELLHRNPVTPYAGRRLTGVVRTTWVGGSVTHGPDATALPMGTILKRGRA